MKLRNDAMRWGPVSQSLHWLIVALVAIMAWLGLTMTDLPSGVDKIRTYALHKSLGLAVLGLVVLRLSWRLLAGAPAPIPGVSPWQERIAASTHVAMYVLLVALPVSGWVLNSAAGYPLPFFGLFNLPHLVGRDARLHDLSVEVHEALFWTLTVLVVVHAAAAFYHHLFLRDATLARMLPRGWLRAGDHDADT